MEALEAVAAYLYGTANPTSSGELEDHIKQCHPCEDYVARFAHVLLAVDAISGDDLSPQVRNRLASVAIQRSQLRPG
ncbi:hypothetical protein AWB92_27300 [Mycobacterium sp. IEC1808]|uniref:zf-HC2 domain-containing protein n=1 Tax=Mycobacterium sp. IEC1808 TaxID=1743230 RepID=UPI000A23852D|nr:zf-HC2 domain-containing protein [Mycobacterium sp. IEC1808]ORW85207.1 hypothetical protein AWB92_27300 [Mycobacterium sp. IEC1808]